MGIMTYGAQRDHGRRRVEVVHSTSVAGEKTPLEIVWEDGRRFRVDRVLDRRMARSLRSGGEGVRFTVLVGRTVTHLWYDGTYWSVDERVRAGGEG